MTQFEQVYDALKKKPMTMKEVTTQTGIVREHICRYIATMKKENMVWMTKMRRCKITGELVKEWTCDESKIPNLPKQQTLF